MPPSKGLLPRAGLPAAALVLLLMPVMLRAQAVAPVGFSPSGVATSTGADYIGNKTLLDCVLRSIPDLAEECVRGWERGASSLGGKRPPKCCTSFTSENTRRCTPEQTPKLHNSLLSVISVCIRPLEADAGQVHANCTLSGQSCMQHQRSGCPFTCPLLTCMPCSSSARRT
jgi:hypothetical protein